MQLCMYIVCVHVIHILLFIYCTYNRDNHKDKDDYKGSVECDPVAAEATSIQGSPTEVTYAATTQALHGNTDTVQMLQYTYARTDAARVRNCIKYIFSSQSTFIAT